MKLEVYDVCDSSIFENGPLLTPDNYIFYIGEDALVVSASFQKDYISRTTTNICGTYAISAALNLGSSTINGGPVDYSRTNVVGIDASNL